MMMVARTISGTLTARAQSDMQRKRKVCQPISIPQRKPGPEVSTDRDEVPNIFTHVPGSHTSEPAGVLRFNSLTAGPWRASVVSMKWFVLLVVAAGTAWNRDATQDVNVNSRYTIEAVEVGEKYEARLSPRLKDDLNQVVGEKFDQETIDRLGERIRKELRGYEVVLKVLRGAKPETVRVVFEVVRKKARPGSCCATAHLPLQAELEFRRRCPPPYNGHNFSFGILTDNDE